MFSPDDLKPLSAAIGTAVAAGLALGLWLTPAPDHPDAAAATVDDSQPIAQIDPNLASYQAMAAANDVGPTPYPVVPAYTAQQTVADATPPEDVAFVRDDADATTAAPAAAFDNDATAAVTPVVATAPAQPADSPATGAPAAG